MRIRLYEVELCAEAELGKEKNKFEIDARTCRQAGSRSLRCVTQRLDLSPHLMEQKNSHTRISIPDRCKQPFFLRDLKKKKIMKIKRVESIKRQEEVRRRYMTLRSSTFPEMVGQYCIQRTMLGLNHHVLEIQAQLVP